MSLVGTQQERRHQLVNCEGANAATNNMTQDAHFEMVRRTGSIKNQKQQAVGCEYIHNKVNGRKLTI